MKAGFGHKTLILVPALVVAFCMAGRAAGQSRKGVGIEPPGSFKQVGTATRGYEFSRYSYGVGTAQAASSSSQGGGLLRSSISSPGGYSIPRASGSAPQALSNLGSPSGSRSRWLVKPQPTLDLSTSVGRITVPEIQDMEAAQESALDEAGEYVRAAESASVLQKKDETEPIISLVPTEDSLYARFLAQGEKAFRDGRFPDAVAMFGFAYDMSPQVPEGLVSLTHGSFAVSTYSYGRTAFYLKEALKYFPELPLAPLRPKGFYGDQSNYVDHLIRLEDHISRYSDDAEALLVLAYFRWFQEKPDVKTVRESLGRALAAATQEGDHYTIEAVDAFWNGIVASGQASGKLGDAAAAPAGGPTSRPAEKPEQAKSNAESAGVEPAE